MRVCSEEKCSSYAKRMYNSNFCSACGGKMRDIKTCCKDESLTDSGFCSYCGTKKTIQFLEEEISHKETDHA